jgi:hypothetical protein
LDRGAPTAWAPRGSTGVVQPLLVCPASEIRGIGLVLQRVAGKTPAAAHTRAIRPGGDAARLQLGAEITVRISGARHYNN